MTNLEKAQAIIRDRDMELNRLDLMAIDRHLNSLDPDQHGEISATVYEAISLIITDPQYRGDIAPKDLA